MRSPSLAANTSLLSASTPSRACTGTCPRPQLSPLTFFFFSRSNFFFRVFFLLYVYVCVRDERKKEEKNTDLESLGGRERGGAAAVDKHVGCRSFLALDLRNQTRSAPFCTEKVVFGI